MNRYYATRPGAHRDSVIAKHHRLYLRVIHDHNFDHVTLLRYLPRRTRDLSSHRRQLSDRFLAQVMHRELESGFRQIYRHWFALLAEPDKADLDQIFTPRCFA
jgi:hypothetical protein